MEKIEWGVKRVWPSGYSEVKRADSRHDAEVSARLHNSAGRGSTAELVSRVIVVGEWQPAADAEVCGRR